MSQIKRPQPELAVILGLVLSLFGATAVAAKPDVLTPEFRFVIADAGKARALFNDNSWFKEFNGSNLYHGALIRLSPVLTSLGSTEKNAWEGRLVDFLAEKLLNGRRMTVAYYHASGLVSPFGILIEELGSAEQAIADGLIAKLRTKEPQDGVTPVSLKAQKFGVVRSGTCLAISRDPKIAAQLSRDCTKPVKLTSDAALVVNVREAVPPFFVPLNRLFGVEPLATVHFKWESGKARFFPEKAQFGLKGGSLWSNGKAPEELLEAIPADAWFVAMGFIPDPGAFNPQSLQKLLQMKKETLAKKPGVPVTLVHLGTLPSEGENQPPRGLSVLILPAGSVGGDAALQGTAELFNEKGRFESRYKRVCRNYIAISRWVEAIDRIEAACAKKVPTFRNLSDKVVESFSTEPFSLGILLSLAKGMASSLDFGWKLNNKDAPPSELRTAESLLLKLPTYSFSGRTQAQALLLKGSE